ncbi:putative glycosyl hydrolase [Colletotrichum asianum]|uniref:Putative glycosyl hydrolase n=1 Tax=Colletotrichum asianum TaxID=702518 RepID=A0A8H3ZUD6_9PEZI|nr:putative glycosyl hydrolase [Colletotrichum asianum]
MQHDDHRLVYRYDGEQVWIEPWGPDAFRIRATKAHVMPSEAWALEEKPPSISSAPQLSIADVGSATITNGNAKACISKRGKITVINSRGKVVLGEYARNRCDLLDAKCSAIEVEAREFKPLRGGDYHLTMRFESLDTDERIFGMGQYQLPHRPRTCTPQFAGQPIGRVVFGKNTTSFEAYATKALDYWVVVADTPAQIVERYADVAGKAPMMPEHGLGFWQCKLRYETQDQLLEVAEEYRRRELPLDLIVVDFFHWPMQGEGNLTPSTGLTQANWRSSMSGNAMVKRLNALGVELMVSIWPTVDQRSSNFQEMLEKGFLVRTERGVRTNFEFEGQTVYYDPTNPDARRYVWNKAKGNYYTKGIKTFWLDQAEPEYSVYDFDNYRYFLGPNLQVGNIYPRDYARTFFDGMRDSGQENPVNLLRCAWAGSQKYGALVWSGDIASSWSSFRNQLAAGLNMGIAGLPWWTTDIGGFHGGIPKDESFHELFVRWFQWGAFCPVMRLHGDREPKSGNLSSSSGAPNEVWSYGPAVYEICRKYLLIREQLRSYTRRLMAEAHEKGSPVIRPLFYEFPNDPQRWKLGATQYMYGDAYLCCPVVDKGIRKMKVYLPILEPGEQWTSFTDVQSEVRTWEGGSTVEVDCPLELMPVFVRNSRAQMTLER